MPVAAGDVDGVREQQGMGVTRVPADSARAGPSEAARSELAHSTRNVCKSSAVSKARSAQGTTGMAPRAEDVGVGERPVYGGRPGEVGGVSKGMVSVVYLAVDASPSREPSEAEYLQREL